MVAMVKFRDISDDVTVWELPPRDSRRCFAITATVGSRQFSVAAEADRLPLYIEAEIEVALDHKLMEMRRDLQAKEQRRWDMGRARRTAVSAY